MATRGTTGSTAASGQTANHAGALCLRLRRALRGGLTLGAALACGVLTLEALPTAAQVKAGSLVSLSTQPSMNVFRRFAADRVRMTEFYGTVLGLKALRPISLGGGNEMIRFQVGTAEIKLQGTADASKFAAGAVNEVVGLRVFTLFFPDEAALTARFAAHGYPAPLFKPRGKAGERVALVQDPERQWVELVVVPGAPAETFDRFEVGLTVSDLEKSRAFYRSFIGLEELAPATDALLGVMKYPFRHGTMTVNVWSFGTGLPANPTGAGIQYVVTNVETVAARAKAEQVKIDRPLGPFGTGLRTIWLGDPDGITNYFAQIMTPAAQPSSAAPSAQGAVR
jgi:catechol 2,3-dioxygenase-like lactoylglutathione lyase family enzyme